MVEESIEFILFRALLSYSICIGAFAEFAHEDLASIHRFFHSHIEDTAKTRQYVDLLSHVAEITPRLTMDAILSQLTDVSSSDHLFPVKQQLSL